MTLPAPIAAPIIAGVPVQTVRPAAAAALVGRSERTIRRWIAAGILPAVRMPSGGLGIRVADLNSLGEPA